MQCPNCGLETSGAGGVCHVCGAVLFPRTNTNHPAQSGNASPYAAPQSGSASAQSGNASPYARNASGAWAGNAAPRPGHASKTPIWKNNTVITASLVALCVVLLLGIVAATGIGKRSKPATPSQPAAQSQGEPVDTNRYKVQQVIEAERARRQDGSGEASSDSGAAVPASASSGSSSTSGKSSSSGNSSTSGKSSSSGSSASSGSSSTSGKSSSSDSSVPDGKSSSSGKTQSGYLLDGSDRRYVKSSELSGFTAEQCRLARNELYARHGRKFQDKTIQAYFDSCDWYTPSIEPGDFSENMLNAYEIANRNLILNYEKEKGYQ